MASREDDLSLAKAVIVLDLAVEQMLNAAIMDFTSLNAPKGKSGRKDIGWADIWTRAAEVMKSMNHELRNHSQLLSLHDVRNLTVHNGSVASRGEVQRYIEPVEETLAGVFREAYSLDFARFRLWDLINNEALKQLMIDSETAQEKHHSSICVIGCLQAHNVIVEAMRELTRSRRIRLSQAVPKRYASYQSWPSGVPYQMVRKLEEAARQVEKELDRREKNLRSTINDVARNLQFLEDEVVTIGIGMPVVETRRFQNIGDAVMRRVNSVPRIIPGSDSEFIEDSPETPKGAEFMLNYLSRLIRLIQGSSPEVVEQIKVEQPLTAQRWWKTVENRTANKSTQSVSS